MFWRLAPPLPYIEDAFACALLQVQRRPFVAPTVKTPVAPLHRASMGECMSLSLDEFAALVVKSAGDMRIGSIDCRPLSYDLGSESRLDRLCVKGITVGLDGFILRPDSLVAKAKAPKRKAPLAADGDFLAELLAEERSSRLSRLRQHENGARHRGAEGAGVQGGPDEDAGFMTNGDAERDDLFDPIVAELIGGALGEEEGNELVALVPEGNTLLQEEASAMEVVEDAEEQQAAAIVMSAAASNGDVDVEALQAEAFVVAEAVAEAAPAAGDDEEPDCNRDGNAGSDLSQLYVAYGLQDRSPHDILDAASGDLLGTLHTIKDSVKATCKIKSHGRCVLWVNCRNSSVAAAMGDCLKWLSEGRTSTETEHFQSCNRVKRAHGMRVK